MKPIDFARCERAMRDIEISGVPGRSGVRGKAIEDAIAAIQEDGNKAITDRYIGVKNYAAFGDQREDHECGYGPSHGHIVFSIRRTRGSDVKLGADHVYLLECVRDVGGIEVAPSLIGHDNHSRITKKTITVNLVEFLSRIAQLDEMC